MVDYWIIAQDIWADWAPLVVLGAAVIGIVLGRYIKKKSKERKAKAAMVRKQGYGQAPMPEGGQPTQAPRQVQPQPPTTPVQRASPPPVEQPEQPQHPKPVPPPSKEEDKFLQMFSDSAGIEEDITNNLASLSHKMERATDEMDRNVDEEIKKLSQQLIEINTKKEQVRQYGKKLARLFERYEQREQQLAGTLTQLDRIAERQKKQQKLR